MVTTEVTEPLPLAWKEFALSKSFVYWALINSLPSFSSHSTITPALEEFSYVLWHDYVFYGF